MSPPQGDHLTCIGILAQAFHCAPMSQALRQRDFPATLMMLSRDLTAFVPPLLSRNETEEGHN